MKTILLTILFTATWLHAAVVTTTVSTTTNLINCTLTVNLPQFNGSLGKLTNVTINCGWQLTRTNHVESFDYTPLQYNLDYFCFVNLLFPDNSLLKSDSVSDSFGGPIENSGAEIDTTVRNYNNFNAGTCNGFAPARANWIGTGVLAFKLVFDDTVTFTTTPVSNDVLQSSVAYGSGSVTISYFYTPGGTGSEFACH